jgi:hypothetical protein
MRHISGEGIKQLVECSKFPRAQWSPSLGNVKKVELNKTLHRVGLLTKWSNRARRTLVREVTKNPLNTDRTTEFLG